MNPISMAPEASASTAAVSHPPRPTTVRPRPIARRARMVRRSTRALIAGSAALLFAAAPTSAQIPVSETRFFTGTMSGPPTVLVDIPIGSVTVVGSASGQVRVTGTRGGDTDGVDVVVTGNQVTIEARIPEGVEGDIDTSVDLQIAVPAAASVELDLLSADAEVEGVTGTVFADIASGDLSIRGNPSRVEAEVLSGDVDITVQGAPVIASVAAGDLTVRGARGTLELEVASGDITADGADLDRASVQVSSGDVGLTASLAEGGVMEVEATSGDATVTIPAATSAQLTARTFSGEIDSDVSGDQVQAERYAPGQTLRATLGAGAGRIEIQTFSGDIRIRRGG